MLRGIRDQVMLQSPALLSLLGAVVRHVVNEVFDERLGLLEHLGLDAPLRRELFLELLEQRTVLLVVEHENRHATCAADGAGIDEVRHEEEVVREECLVVEVPVVVGVVGVSVVVVVAPLFSHDVSSQSASVQHLH